MCLFPLPNPRVNSLAFSKGITQFDCGACPECLKRRASRIMLRDVYEAMDHVDNCMCTLTYDQYLRDSSGRIIGESVADRSVDKRDVQLFIKRLRQYVLRHYGVKFKYRLSAEYGKRTHRPHYHVLFFGWCFPDCEFYKKSKRGNPIYTSALLTKIWKFGICTVDCKRITASTARYCSKYTMKASGAEDTFSLCSTGIGIDSLYRHFNGKSYWIDGVEYPIPRQVWERYISDCYLGGALPFDIRYVNYSYETLTDGSYARSNQLRENYRFVRDSDPLYNLYLEYWRKRGEIFKLREKPIYQRILELPDDKYYFYKVRALSAGYLGARSRGIPVAGVGSKCVSAYYHYYWEHFRMYPEDTCRIPSCHYTASDTKKCSCDYKARLFGIKFRPLSLNPFDNPRKFLENYQISIDSLENV